MRLILTATFFSVLLCAQMPMGEVCRPGKPTQDLNLSEMQQNQIASICKESFKGLAGLRDAWKKAENELQAAFDESPVDQRKSNDAIEKLISARADVFRATSQMELKIRTVLTDEQWRELKMRQHRNGMGRPGRRGGPSPKGGPPTITQQNP